MNYVISSVVLILMILVFLWVATSKTEQFDVGQDLGLDMSSAIVNTGENNALGQTNNSMPIDMSVLRGEDQPYVRLYEDYQKKDLAYEYSPVSGHGSHRQFMRISLKHVEAYLPKTNSGPYGQVRRIAIWSVYGGAPNASLLSTFYNAYLEPDTELRANSARYKKLAEIKPGQRVSLDITEPTKQIFLYAIM